MAIGPVPSEPEVVKWFEVDNEHDLASLGLIFEKELDKLRNAGLSTSLIFRKGTPKALLIEEAENWSADSLFVGAKGIRGLDRLLLGSVSATVAAQAPCSVEVCRSH
jgi:nucleotide-binding universal stress UspA family protein